MKKIQLAFAALTFAFGFTACSNHGSGSTSSDSNTATTTTTTTDTSTAASTGATTTTTASKTPLNAADSSFVMRAAAGGMMEVEAGNLAQQNAQSDRVKAFGSMMVKDHSAANQELTSLASGRGITLPAELPADMKKHVDMMRNMKGKQFDTHYMSMMLSDHKKDVAEFEKQSNSANDADLKAWASKTLPTLKMHLDSAQAINKGKM